MSAMHFDTLSGHLCFEVRKPFCRYDIIPGCQIFADLFLIFCRLLSSFVAFCRRRQGNKQRSEEDPGILALKSFDEEFWL